MKINLVRSLQEQLRRCLCIRLPKLLQVHQVGLIVIDSIAGVFRSENMGVNYVNRSQEFHNIASQLNKLADKFEIVIVCVNQVSIFFGQQKIGYKVF